MRDDFGALFAANASLRRAPTPSEITTGIPCGPLDLQLWDEMLFTLSSLLSECNSVLDAAGIAPDPTKINQLQAAIAFIAANNNISGLTAAQRLQTFTSTGIYTVVSSTVKITGVASGGGGNNSFGGGAGAAVLGYLTGLTIGRTINLQLGAPGTGTTTTSGTGGNASDTVISSGTQTISTITLGGGKGATSTGGGPGGTATVPSGSVPQTGNGGGNGVGGISAAYAPNGTGGSISLNGVVINGAAISNNNGAPPILVFEAVA